MLTDNLPHTHFVVRLTPAETDSVVSELSRLCKAGLHRGSLSQYEIHGSNVLLHGTYYFCGSDQLHPYLSFFTKSPSITAMLAGRFLSRVPESESFPVWVEWLEFGVARGTNASDTLNSISVIREINKCEIWHKWEALQHPSGMTASIFQKGSSSTLIWKPDPDPSGRQAKKGQLSTHFYCS